MYVSNPSADEVPMATMAPMQGQWDSGMGQVMLPPAAPSSPTSSAGGGCGCSAVLGNAIRATISLLALIVGFFFVLHVTNQGPRECYPAPSDDSITKPTDESAFFYGYTGAAIAMAGGCLGAAYAAAAGGSVVGALFALPLAVYSLTMAVIIIGAIDVDDDNYCPKMGYAHYASGVMSGFGGVAGGITIGTTQLVPRVEGAGCCTALQNAGCCARNLMAIVTGIVGNLLALIGLVAGLVASSGRCENSHAWGR
jgi:hypothetical protein